MTVHTSRPIEQIGTERLLYFNAGSTAPMGKGLHCRGPLKRVVTILHYVQVVTVWSRVVSSSGFGGFVLSFQF